jgi:hypothetical protein
MGNHTRWRPPNYHIVIKPRQKKMGGTDLAIGAALETTLSGRTQN